MEEWGCLWTMNTISSNYDFGLSLIYPKFLDIKRFERDSFEE